jgi:uncharacterized protein YeaO (DUF488 family)
MCSECGEKIDPRTVRWPVGVQQKVESDQLRVDSRAGHVAAAEAHRARIDDQRQRRRAAYFEHYRQELRAQSAHAHTHRIEVHLLRL